MSDTLSKQAKNKCDVTFGQLKCIENNFKNLSPFTVSIVL